MSCNKLGNFPTDNSPKFHERNLEEKKSNMIFIPFLSHLSRAHVESCNFVELGESSKCIPLVRNEMKAHNKVIALKHSTTCMEFEFMQRLLCYCSSDFP